MFKFNSGKSQLRQISSDVITPTRIGIQPSNNFAINVQQQYCHPICEEMSSVTQIEVLTAGLCYAGFDLER